MKTRIITVVIAMLFAASAFAIDTSPQQPGSVQNIEQRKAQILKRIDQRIARDQEFKSCIQAANTPEEVKSCQDTFKAKKTH